MLLLLAKNVQKLHNYDYHLRRSKVVGVKGPTGEPVAHGGALVRAACLVYAWLCLTSCWAFKLIVAPARYQGI